jgi:WD40 repeat protein
MLTLLAEPAADGDLVAAAPDGRRWAAATVDYVTLWEDAEPAGELPPAPGRVLGLAYGPDGAELLAAPHRADLGSGAWRDLGHLAPALDPMGDEGYVAVTAAWALAGDVLVVAAERDPRRAMPGTPGQRVVVLDGREPRATLWEHDDWMRVEALAADDRQIAAAALEVRVWARESDGTPTLLPERGSQVRRVALSPGGDRLAVSYADGEVAVTGGDGPLAAAEVLRPAASWRAHADDACALAFHPGGEMLATGGWDDRVALWDLEGNELGSFAVGAHVADLTFLGGDRLVACRAAPDSGAMILRVAARDR